MNGSWDAWNAHTCDDQAPPLYGSIAQAALKCSSQFYERSWMAPLHTFGLHLTLHLIRCSQIRKLLIQYVGLQFGCICDGRHLEDDHWKLSLFSEAVCSRRRVLQFRFQFAHSADRHRSPVSMMSKLIKVKISRERIRCIANLGYHSLNYWPSTFAEFHFSRQSAFVHLLWSSSDGLFASSGVMSVGWWLSFTGDPQGGFYSGDSTPFTFKPVAVTAEY